MGCGVDLVQGGSDGLGRNVEFMSKFLNRWRGCRELLDTLRCRRVGAFGAMHWMTCWCRITDVSHGVFFRTKLLVNGISIGQSVLRTTNKLNWRTRIRSKKRFCSTSGLLPHWKTCFKKRWRGMPEGSAGLGQSSVSLSCRLLCSVSRTVNLKFKRPARCDLRARWPSPGSPTNYRWGRWSDLG